MWEARHVCKSRKPLTYSTEGYSIAAARAGRKCLLPSRLPALMPAAAPTLTMADIPGKNNRETLQPLTNWCTGSTAPVTQSPVVDRVQAFCALAVACIPCSFPCFSHVVVVLCRSPCPLCLSPLPFFALLASWRLPSPVPLGPDCSFLFRSASLPAICRAPQPLLRLPSLPIAGGTPD